MPHNQQPPRTGRRILAEMFGDGVRRDLDVRERNVSLMMPRRSRMFKI